MNTTTTKETEEIINNINANLTIIRNLCTKHHLFISGSVATGKTTIFYKLKNKLCSEDNVYFINEYIDYDSEGEIFLRNLFADRISNFEFQHYIIDCYEKQLKSEEYNSADLIIWERHPFDALTVFCSNDNSLNIEEKYNINQRLTTLCAQYEIPLISDENTSLSSLDTSRISLTTAHEVILNSYIYPTLGGFIEYNLYLFFYCSNEFDQIKRINKRGRISEITKYKRVQDIIPLNTLYSNMYLSVRRKKTRNKLIK
ncbi:hypothetical protein KM1_216130 [Entamoeba histolytica HM-3:IMSS]|uniref:Deoxynucleoside kinase domain-containing protein n=1 Tax=Entamoeba histolytica HM-3:IMSS TaxID=885315 RepID=M7W2B5_ENTHI|nr:hypothetical protein KM1_216130 [Entamoeba histolytica HM-3:IMSS]